jgi:streptogramin lyase
MPEDRLHVSELGILPSSPLALRRTLGRTMESLNVRTVRRILAIATGFLAIGAVWLSSNVAAKPIGLIKEFRVGSNIFDLTPGPDGNIWFTTTHFFHPSGQGTVGRITPQGKMTRFKVGLNPHSEPGSIVAGPDGNLWFADDGPTSAIGRITPEGAITEFSAGINRKGDPWKITVGPDGNLWFTSTRIVDAAGGETIGRITPQGEITEFSQGLNPESAPGNIVAGPDGNVWFGDEAEPSPAIGRITPAGEITEFGGLPSAQFQIFNGPAVGSDGNLWFSTSGPPLSVSRITPAGALTNFSSGLSPQNYALGPFAPGSDGNLWFGVTGEPLGHGKRKPAGFATGIGRATATGRIAEFGECIPQTSRLSSLAAGPDGNVWFTRGSSGAIPSISTMAAVGRITPSGKITEFRAGLRPASEPESIVAGTDGSMWFLDRETESIGRITPSSRPANTFLVLPAETRRNGTADLSIVVPGPGTLKLRQISPTPRRGGLARLARSMTATAKATSCGRVTFHVKPNSVAKNKLNRLGAVPLKTRITFTPTGGTPYRRFATIVLSHLD